MSLYKVMFYALWGIQSMKQYLWTKPLGIISFNFVNL